MNMINKTLLFDEESSTFTIRIFGQTTVDKVVTLFQQYEYAVAEKIKNRKFNVIINVDNEAHSSMIVLRKIRYSLENQKYRNQIDNIVAINENKSVVEMRNASLQERLLPFFINEEEAMNYIKNKIIEKSN